MSNATTVILLPFLFAFLVFVARFYFKDGAHSMLRPSFLLALVTIVIVGVYLSLAVSNMLPEYGTVGFGVVGLALLALSLYWMAQI